MSDPIPSEQVIAKVYSSHYNYPWFEKRKVLKKLQSKHRLMRNLRYIPQGAITLDVGCGHGFLVEDLQKRGYQSYGYDYSIDKQFQKKGNHFFYGKSIFEIPIEIFDFISAWHSLEHMSDPRKVLKHLRKKLGTNGRLLLAIPNSNCLGMKIKKQKWVWFQEPYIHIFHFNADNIQILLKQSGFKIERILTTDTWDAQVYDFGIDFGIAAFKCLTGQRGKEWFVIEETTRLMTTPISYIFSFIFRKLKLGSELIVIAS